MKQHQRRTALKLAKSLLPAEEFKRVMSLKINDTGFGYDPFGLEKETAVLGFALAWQLYHYWFRVQSSGQEHLPEGGRVLYVPNHSGVLPFDGMMIAVDLVSRSAQPRLVRGMVDHFMGFLPFVNTFFYRAGQVVGARRNFVDLLERDEAVIVFPEGAKGTGKRWHNRYRLLRFNVGFVELALQYRAPIVPVAVIGAEEQAPMLHNLKPLAKLMGFPYFPITPFFPWLGPFGMLPLPVRYHLYYGKPIDFYRDYPPETVKDPATVRMLADKVQLAVQGLVDEGLRRRTSIFDFTGE
ncbi:MAG: hypothetical protein A2284_01440 [Deltaproteobacteria bacterium RIFOXYA12_FULL_61_11]|nr:MAG: hypothetical protein A2284_01440 [Deltaproteobacteria bacterium RIFOXYA12_FULL_61_11]